MSIDSGINLQNAAFFSALAYAAPTFGNSILWGLTQSVRFLPWAKLA